MLFMKYNKNLDCFYCYKNLHWIHSSSSKY